MTTQQNIARAATADADDIARLLVAGLAGQRSPFARLEHWSGRELDAINRAAEELLPLYRDGLLVDELIARLGRSMDRSS